MSTEDKITVKEALTSIGIALLEDFQDKKEESFEDFEWYTHVLKLKIHTRDHNFCSRLVKGYEILIDEVQKTKT